MRKLILLLAAAAAALTSLPAGASHFSRECHAAASGAVVGPGPSCTLDLSCDRETPGTCAWRVRIGANVVGVMQAVIGDSAGKTYAGCTGLSGCSSDSREWIQLTQGQKLTLTCTTTVVGSGPRLGCYAPQAFP